MGRVPARGRTWLAWSAGRAGSPGYRRAPSSSDRDVRPRALHPRCRIRLYRHAGECLASRSVASELTDSLWREYEAFSERGRSELKVAYLFVCCLRDPQAERGLSGGGARLLERLRRRSKRAVASGTRQPRKVMDAGATSYNR